MNGCAVVRIAVAAAGFIRRSFTYRRPSPERHRAEKRALRDARIPHEMNTPQRPDWAGHPVELGAAWTLRKGDKVAQRVLVSHQLGWELRLMTSDSLWSQVCRSSDEVLETHEAWKVAMLSKGWIEGGETTS